MKLTDINKIYSLLKAHHCDLPDDELTQILPLLQKQIPLVSARRITKRGKKRRRQIAEKLRYIRKFRYDNKMNSDATQIPMPSTTSTAESNTSLVKAAPPIQPIATPTATTSITRTAIHISKRRNICDDGDDMWGNMQLILKASSCVNVSFRADDQMYVGRCQVCQNYYTNEERSLSKHTGANTLRWAHSGCDLQLTNIRVSDSLRAIRRHDESNEHKCAVAGKQSSLHEILNAK